jgi:hypothetical protein
MPTPDTILLHLSDLHFGADHTAAHVNDRDLCLQKLLDTLGSLESDWRPSILAITGDLGWAGKDDDYDKARTWLSQVSSRTNIPPQAFVLSPGNHDLVRSIASTMPRPDEIQEANNVFANGIPPYRLEPFAAYTRFCISLGVPPLVFGGKQCSVFGATTIGDLRFVVVNTAWFSKDDKDRLNLRIGMPLVKQLERDGALITQGELDSRPLTVALLHHPAQWLHDEETRGSPSPDEGSYLYIASRCHLVLSGHTHEGALPHGRAKGGTIEISCGATFKAAGHPNQFQLIRFKTDRIEYRQFVYEKESSGGHWRSLDVRSALYCDSGTGIPQPAISADLSIPDIQQPLQRYAREYALAKSKALTPGSLPDLVPLKVERHYRRGTDDFDSAERIAPEELLKDSNRILVWGDLGSGKSTSLARLIEKVNGEADRVGILIPAADLVPFLPVAPQPLGVAAISSYLTQGLFRDRGASDIASAILANADETIVAVDGLDEVNPTTARQIFEGLADIPSTFAGVRVVATSRQIPDDYSLGPEWLSAFMATLTDEERLRILEAAAVASGPSDGGARKSAQGVFQQIAQDAILDEVATSPLALRLLYRRLAGTSAPGQISLADLLYTLLLERVADWELADGKTNPVPDFCRAMPSAEQRVGLLSALASEMGRSNGITSARAREVLRVRLVQLHLPEAVTTQALEFFAWAGLVHLTEDNVEFALRPLFEIAQVPSVIERLQGEATTINPTEWRTVSFAAALERSRGRLPAIIEPLSRFVSRHLAEPRWAVPACFIVAETRIRSLAEMVVAALRTRRFSRPLYLFSDHQRTTCIAIARTVALAGDTGFDWFFDEYLNPRYPWFNSGSRVPEMVFEEWISLVGADLTERQIHLMGQIPGPNLATDGFPTIRVVPLAILAAPNAVSTAVQLEYLPRLLTHSTPPIVSRALARLRELAAREPVLAQAALLRNMARQSEYGARCAGLWLESEPSKKPPKVVVETVLRSRGNWTGQFFEESIRQQLVERLGLATWLRLCKWELGNTDESVALGAALEMSAMRPDLGQLVDGIVLDSLHAGRGAPSLEDTLRSSFSKEPRKHAIRLANRIADAGQRSWDSAPPAWWRLFLDLLASQKEEGPRLLAKAVSGIGQYVLARHPEVRRRLRALANSREASAYVAELERLLKLGTSAQRMGAAQVLVCMGASLPDALLTSARAVAEPLSNMWEWERYCLSRKFPPTVLDAVLAGKAQLSEGPLRFVLALAVADGRTLAPEDVRLTLMVGRSGGLTDRLANTNEGFEFLVASIHGEDEKCASRAARLLLRFHGHRLAADDIACQILSFEPDGARIAFDLAQPYRRLLQDSTYRARVIEAGKDLATRFGRRLLLPALADAAGSDNAWANVLWSLFCESNSLHDQDQVAAAIFQLFGEIPQVRQELGTAARELCYDERLRVGPFPNSLARLWLALLAHECAKLTDGEAADVLRETGAEWRHHAARTALIARTNQHSPEFDAPATALPEQTSRSIGIGEIVDAVRDGGHLHPRAGAIIRGALYEERDEADLIRLSESGRRARVLSGILAFIYDRDLRPEWALKALDDEVWQGMATDECGQHLTHLATLAIRAAINQDATKVEQHIRTLMRSSTGDAINGARLWNMMDRPWAGEDFALALQAYTQYPYVTQRDLLLALVENLPPEIDPTMLAAVEESIEALAMREREEFDPLAYLALPLVLWRAGVLRSETSSTLFRSGLLKIFDHAKERSPTDELGQVSGLLLAAPKHRIREAITLKTDDPRSAIFTILAAVTNRE